MSALSLVSAKLGPKGIAIGGPHDRGLLGQKVRKKVFNWSEVNFTEVTKVWVL